MKEVVRKLTEKAIPLVMITFGAERALKIVKGLISQLGYIDLNSKVKTPFPAPLKNRLHLPLDLPFR